MPVKIVLNKAGVNQLLTELVKPDIKRRADNAKEAASAEMDDPDGMLVVDASDGNRARYIVITASAEAVRGEALDRRLTRSIDAARS